MNNIPFLIIAEHVKERHKKNLSNVKGERYRIYTTALHEYNENLSDVFNKEDLPQQQMDQINLGYHFYRLQSPKKHRSDSTMLLLLTKFKMHDNS